MELTRPAALLLIDIQQGLDDPRLGERNNPGAEQQVAVLLAGWRQVRWPVAHVQHMSVAPDSPLRPELPGSAFKPEAMPAPGEPVFRKSVNSAFIGTGLEAHLRRAGIRTLVMVGLTTDHCVSSTARNASDLGFQVVIVSDATAAFARTDSSGRRHPAEQVHQVTLASLHREFGRVGLTAEVLAALSAD